MGVWISRGNFISLLYKACAVSLYTILVRKIGGHFVTLFFNMSQNDLKLPNRILLIFSAIHIKSFAFRFATPITVSNIIFSSKGFINQTIDAKRTIQSLFGTAQVGWKDALYLDVTARNDWSSTLANTESMKNGFFYPSVGLTWIMSNSVKLPEWINFSKFRGSFAQVGNDLPIGITNLADIIQCGGSIQTNDIEQRGDLKPEISC